MTIGDNDSGEILACSVTTGNTDDRHPVPKLMSQTHNLFGKLFGDKGYLSEALTQELLKQYMVQLVTKLRKTIKAKLMDEMDKYFLRKRAIIGSLYDQLKNISQIEHSRHRSLTDFMINLMAGLIAYSLQPKKPSLNLKFIPQLAVLKQN